MTNALPAIGRRLRYHARRQYSAEERFRAIRAAFDDQGALMAVRQDARTFKTEQEIHRRTREKHIALTIIALAAVAFMAWRLW